MHPASPLLATLVIALALAFALGLGARMLRVPPLLGYIAAGLMVGPHTPGFVADASLTSAMAEIGVALLLFGVGLHFRPRDLLTVWRVALPGALAQITAGTALGAMLGHFAFGLGMGPAIALGIALAISSTAVATRSLEERGRLGGEAGRLALGWLVVQDLVVVLALVLLPAMAAGGDDKGLQMALAKTGAQLVAFLVVMAVVGRVMLPRLLALVAATGSRELFTLAVVVVALGTAFGSAALFGVSPALGGFFAGVLLAESPLGHQAAAETTALQRIFVALFFVSVGMMVDPLAVVAAPWLALAALLVILLGTGVAILLLLVALRVALPTAAVVAGSMAQIGEFSFVLLELAIGRDILPGEVRAPLLAAATLAIVLTPVSMLLTERLAGYVGGAGRFQAWQARRAGAHPLPPLPTKPSGHAVIAGYGRVGRVVAQALVEHGIPFIAIEADHALAETLRQEGIAVIWGDAAQPEVLKAAHPEAARLIVLAMPDAFGCRRVLELARAANPNLAAAVRAHTEEEAALLGKLDGVGLVVMGEREIALGMAGFALLHFGVESAGMQRTVDQLRALAASGATA
ncbi:cation:proton antiporter [Sediminicoccus sp. KRV36]|uniref:cation:proton antiporter domain-containing protein n=1 Tax=Sediminicoccus sp. KRV36 TaxID=3133721 RepID=UPI00200EBE51|nr:cation:proton antiporter [Sediminicoccus rosea]UPY35199.1 cation:proton antiporter [Sediminicoccus rosea]